MAGGAGTDRAVFVGLADAMTFDATASDRGGPFEGDERIRWPLAGAGMKLLRESRSAPPTSPFRHRPPPTTEAPHAGAQKLLIFGLVATAAIGRRHLRLTITKP